VQKNQDLKKKKRENDEISKGTKKEYEERKK
jgi:hypothetical protein